MKQNNSNLVVVVGGPGSSGSSTIAKMLSAHFNIRRVYAGDLFRKKASEAGYDNFEDFLLSVVKKGYYLDNEIDEELVEIAKKGNVLIDSKSFAMICKNIDFHCTVTIWLTASLHVRILRRLSREEIKGFSRVINYFKVRRDLVRRYKIDKGKYWALYRTDYSKPEKYYDIVLDTSKLDVEETFNLILKYIKDGGYVK
jgi:predicted cytidylate kinase